MRIKILITFYLLFLSALSYSEIVKKSSSGICHDQQSSYYSRTKNFKAFDSIESCLASGGRLPANSKKAKRQSQGKYSRNAFRHWIDEDRDCLNTRHELLQSLSTGPVTMNSKGCRVVRGRWNDPYTGKVFFDGSKVDVDHLVPLKWAWINGANQWSSDKREKFANDERNLFIVSASANRSKGAKGPSEWLPPNKAYHCQYVSRYLRMLIIYKFPDSSKNEVKALKSRVCRG